MADTIKKTKYATITWQKDAKAYGFTSESTTKDHRSLIKDAFDYIFLNNGESIFQVTDFNVQIGTYERKE